MGEFSETVERLCNSLELDADSDRSETITISKAEYNLLKSEVAELRSQMNEVRAYCCRRMTAIEYATGIKSKDEWDTTDTILDRFVEHGIVPRVDFEDDVIENKDEILYEELQTRKKTTPHAFVSVTKVKEMFPDLGDHNEAAKRIMRKLIRLHPNDLQLNIRKVAGQKTTVIEFIQK